MNSSRKPPRQDASRRETGEGHRSPRGAGRPAGSAGGQRGRGQSFAGDGGQGQQRRSEGRGQGFGGNSQSSEGQSRRGEGRADERRSGFDSQAARGGQQRRVEGRGQAGEQGRFRRDETSSGQGRRGEGRGVEQEAPRGRRPAQGASFAPEGQGTRGRRNEFGSDQGRGRGGRSQNQEKPADGRTGGQDQPRPTGRDQRPNLPPVERARKMIVRSGSEKARMVDQQLREKRVEARHVGELRLQKALSLSGVGSRRDCDVWVAEGRVSINGRVALPGARVKPGDNIRFDGKPINVRWPDRLPRIVMYHKQEGELVSRDDPEGRTTVFERLPRLQSSAWIAIGRLDFNTSGLLLFTTSGDFANRMMHPRFEVEREYAVRVLGKLTDEQLKALRAGIELDDGTAQFDRIEEQGGEGKNTWYRVILKEGRNREVRRMFEHFDITVSRLMRVRFGALTLPSRLKRGQYYELGESEVLAVMKWAGLGLTGREGEH
ncbi:pseudouridine synthase [Burkholderiaceae bacterium DAT-1]|nr:pseudouridine synthase [Burkholderiaceae bacterium DAT-1]